MKIFNVIWGQLFVAIVTFGSIRFYTELMTPAAFGTAMLGLGILALVDGVFPMAISQTQIALCAPIDDTRIRRRLSIGLSVLFIRLVAPAFAVAILVAVMISVLLKSALPFFVVVAITAYVFTEALKSSALTTLILERNYFRQSTWNFGEVLISFILVVSVLHFSSEWISFLATYIGARICCTFLFLYRYQGRTFLIAGDVELAKLHLKAALQHGLPVSAMGPIGWISAFLDRFIIGALLGTSATGAYVAATGLVGKPYALTTTILSNYFRPQLYLSSPVSGGRKNITLKWVIAAAFIGLSGAICILIIAPLLLPWLLASQYRDGAVAIMFTYAIAQTVSIMTHALDNNLLASGRSRSMLATQLGMSIATLSIIPLGTVVFGPIGATIARCLAEVGKFFVTWLLLSGTFSRTRAVETV